MGFFSRLRKFLDPLHDLQMSVIDSVGEAERSRYREKARLREAKLQEARKREAVAALLRLAPEVQKVLKDRQRAIQALQDELWRQGYRS